MRNLMIAAAALFALPAATQSVPGTINYQGRLTDNSPQQNPVSATVPMQFVIYDAATAGTALWREPAGAAATVPVSVTGGIFSVMLGGNGVAIPATVFSGGTQRWLEITANGDVLAPRQALSATGYANQAQYSASASSATVAITASNALAFGGVAPSGYQLATSQNCGAGQFLNVIANGSASCAAPPANNLNPPVSLAAAVSGTLFSASNTGTGGAGSFIVSSPANGADALVASAAGSGSALHAISTGPGTTAYVANYGAGAAALIYTDNSSSTSPALYAGVNGGTGPVIKTEANNTVSDLFQGWNGVTLGPVFRVDNAGNVSAASQYNLNGGRMLSAPGTDNTFAGLDAGKNNTTGLFNTFAGTGSGRSNTTSSNNSYFGSHAGESVTGSGNSLFGSEAGRYTTSGSNNAFFGTYAGLANSTGITDAYFGAYAGRNSTGLENTFIGGFAGFSNTAANNNTFLGGHSGYYNTSASNNTFLGQWTAISHAAGDNNTALGYNADIADGVSNATAVGANAIATASNTLVLGTAAVTVQAPGNVTVSGVISGNGSGLTNLPGAALTVPVNLSGTSNPVLSATNTGTGTAGAFMVNNSASSAVALQASSNGTGDVIYASTGGGGNGVSSFVNGTGIAVNGYNTGLGAGGSFQISNAANSSNALSAITTGSGRGLFVNNVGTGTGAYVTINNNANSSTALQGFTLGTGRAGLFTISNAASAASALSAVNNGSGTALFAQNTASGDLLQGNNNSGNVLRVDNGGNVTATRFNGSGAGLTNLPGANIAPPVALSASSASPILSATNNGTGSGVTGILMGAGTAGVYGYSSGGASGVWGDSASGAGVYGSGQAGAGVSAGNASAATAALTARNTGAGPLISAANGGGEVFRVDNGGSVTASGRFVIGVYTQDCGAPSTTTAYCTCSNGDPAIGGGAYAHFGQYLRESRPGGSSWVVSCENAAGADVLCWGIYAVCLSHGN